MKILINFRKNTSSLHHLLHPAQSSRYLDNAKSILDGVPDGLRTDTLINYLATPTPYLWSKISAMKYWVLEKGRKGNRYTTGIGPQQWWNPVGHELRDVPVNSLIRRPFCSWRITPLSIHKHGSLFTILCGHRESWNWSRFLPVLSIYQ